MTQSRVYSFLIILLFVLVAFLLFWHGDSIVNHEDPLIYGFHAKSTLNKLVSNPFDALYSVYIQRAFRGTLHEPLFFLAYLPIQNYYWTLYCFGCAVAFLFCISLYSLLSQYMSAIRALLGTLAVFFIPNLLLESFYADTFIVAAAFLLFAYSGIVKRNSAWQCFAFAVAFCIRPVECIAICIAIFAFDRHQQQILRTQIRSLLIAGIWWAPYLPRYFEHVTHELTSTFTPSSSANSSLVQTFFDNLDYYKHLGGLLFIVMSVLTLYKSKNSWLWIGFLSSLLALFLTITNLQYIHFFFFSALIGMIAEHVGSLSKKQSTLLLAFVILQTANGLFCLAMRWDSPLGGLLFPTERTTVLRDIYTQIKTHVPQFQKIPVVGLCEKNKRAARYINTFLASEQLIRRDFEYFFDNARHQTIEGGFHEPASIYIIVENASPAADLSLVRTENTIFIPSARINRWTNEIRRLPNLHLRLIKSLDHLSMESCKNALSQIPES